MGVFTVTKQYRLGLNLLPHYAGGPGDIVSGATGWWGLRAYSSATIGINAIRLRRDSDNAEQDFVTLSLGGLDTNSISNFKGAANLFVTKLYDQTGNGNHVVQATAANQPAFTLSGLGTLPIMTFVAANATTLQTAANFSATYNGVATLNAVLNDAASDGQFIALGASGIPRIDHSGANNLRIFAGVVVSATASDNSWHAIQGVYNGASSDLNVDGTPSTGNSGSNAGVTAVLGIGALGGGGGGASFSASEFGYWDNIAFSSGQSSSISSNQHTYWGF